MRSHLLLREYIQRSLYHPRLGYFSNPNPPILPLTLPRLSALDSQAAYHHQLSLLHSRSAHGWLTPCELFSPYLAQSIALRILKHAPPPPHPIHLVELGPGRATLAHDILTFYDRHHPHVFSRVTYNLLEISSALAKLQTSRLQPFIDSGHAKIINVDINRFFSTKPPVDDGGVGWHVLGMEVLDNLPHDLVRIRDGCLQQARILVDEEDWKSRGELVWEDEVDDETMAAIKGFRLEDAEGMHGWLERMTMGEREIWVPTKAWQLMKGIARVMPQGGVTMADFAVLGGGVAGRNGPVVQRVGSGMAKVYERVEDAPMGQVDIMFPTVFEGLRQVWEDQGGVQGGRIVGLGDMFEMYAGVVEDELSRCKDGYSPVRSEFRNVDVLMINGGGCMD